MTAIAYVWLAAAVVLAVLEMATINLVCIWFVGGAIGAFIAALLGGGWLAQWVVFVAVSAVLLFGMRPLLKKRMTVKPTRTNADRIVGQHAVVTEEVNKLLGTGAIRISGLEWTARTLEEKPIPVGAQVEILRIDGVKVFVESVKVSAKV